MNVVTKNAINICTGVYFTLGLFGYIAFCSQDISGNILMSLSPTMTSDVIKLGFVMSLAFSFPLIIFPCRASLYSFLYRKVHPSQHDHIISHSIPEARFRCLTVCIVIVALGVGWLVPNIELVLGLVGATIGVLICIVFPAACFLNVTFKDTNERLLAKVILVLGLIIMVLGTYANLQAVEKNSKIDRYDDRYITQERIDKLVEDFFQSKKLEKDKDAINKPLVKNDPVAQEKVNEISKDMKKDSEVQPPNPVPPESQSNEKPHITAEKTNDVLKSKEVIPELKKTEKVFETHPKNVKSKLNEGNLSNGENNKKNIVNKLKENTEQKEIPKKESAQASSNEEKIDIMKQQQLIEAIKQHGEEQKELIKEQKEILDEIMKTKKELQQNKNQIGSNEAKKIAVESIKKIADMAIQSLGGVSDKPVNNIEVKRNEPFEKTADEAVKEIAKKAVETIEAIKETNQKQESSLKDGNIVNAKIVDIAPIRNNVHDDNIVQEHTTNYGNNTLLINAQTNTNQQINSGLQSSANNQPVINALPQNMGESQNAIQNEAILNNDNQRIEINKFHLNNNVLPNQQQNQLNQNVFKEKSPLVKKEEKVGKNEKMDINQSQQLTQNQVAQNIAGQNHQQVAVENQNILNQNQHIIQNKASNDIEKQNNEQMLNKQQEVMNNNQQQTQTKINVVQNNVHDVETPKEHSHLPDEPQSYKQGEDTQKNIILNHKNLIPLPLAMTGNSQMSDSISSINKNNDLNSIQNEAQKLFNNNEANPNVESVPIRNKREVVDCTEKRLLKPKEKQICESLVDRDSKKSQEFLPKVDLNDVLHNSLAFDSNLVHMRSLKSYDEGTDR